MYLACSAPFLVNGCVIMKCPIAAVVAAAARAVVA